MQHTCSSVHTVHEESAYTCNNACRHLHVHYNMKTMQVSPVWLDVSDRVDPRCHNFIISGHCTWMVACVYSITPHF